EVVLVEHLPRLPGVRADRVDRHLREVRARDRRQPVRQLILPGHGVPAPRGVARELVALLLRRWLAVSGVSRETVLAGVRKEVPGRVSRETVVVPDLTCAGLALRRGEPSVCSRAGEEHVRGAVTAGCRGNQSPQAPAQSTTT